MEQLQPRERVRVKAFRTKHIRRNGGMVSKVYAKVRLFFNDVKLTLSRVLMPMSRFENVLFFLKV